MFRDEIASEARGGLRADLLVFVCLGADLAEGSVHHFHELSTLRPFRGIMTRIEEGSAIRYPNGRRESLFASSYQNRYLKERT